MVCAVKAKGVYNVTTGKQAQPRSTKAAEYTKWLKDDAIAIFRLSAAMERASMH